MSPLLPPSHTDGQGRKHLYLSLNLALLSILNIFTFFLLHWFVLTRIGPGLETDALFAALVVPQLILSITQTSFRYVLVPLLSSDLERERGQSGWSFFQGTGLLFLILALFLYVTSWVWVGWIVPGFSPEARELTRSLLHIQLLTMIFTALTAVTSAIFHANHRFIFVEIGELIAGVLSLLLLFFFLPKYGIAIAAWALTLRAFLQTLILLPGMGPYRLPDLSSPAMHNAWRRILPLLLGSSYTKLDMLVNRVLSSLAAPGLLSLLYLAQQLYGAGNMVLNKSVTAPIVPNLSRLAEQADWEGFRRLVRTRLLWNTIITVATICILAMLGKPILVLFFSYGQFGEEDIDMLWMILIALFGLLVGGAMGQVLSVSFYTMGDTRTPIRIGVIGFTIGLPLKAVGFYYAGIIGLSLATTLYYFINVMWLDIALRKRIANETTI